MPHVIVKLYAGRSEQQKVTLAEELSKAVMRALGSAEETISVAIEDIDPQHWAEKVYEPDIARNVEKLYKKPGPKPAG
jgi:4-oxalocrotonate tautomerase